MQALKFSLKKDERIFIVGNWITNGHWLLDKAQLLKLRPLKKFASLPDGTYTEDGYESPEIRKLPNIEQVIPRHDDGYVPLDLEQGGTAFVNESFNISGVTYLSKPVNEKTFKIGVAPEYCPLLMLGHKVLVKDKSCPIILKVGGNIVGLIMPVRI